MYTIKKGNLFVKKSGMSGKSSYTTNINKAVKFDTYAEAEKNKCGNETIVKLTYTWGEE